MTDTHRGELGQTEPFETIILFVQLWACLMHLIEPKMSDKKSYYNETVVMCKGVKVTHAGGGKEKGYSPTEKVNHLFHCPEVPYMVDLNVLSEVGGFKHYLAKDTKFGSYGVLKHPS